MAPSTGAKVGCTLEKRKRRESERKKERVEVEEGKKKKKKLPPSLRLAVCWQVDGFIFRFTANKGRAYSLSLSHPLFLSSFQLALMKARLLLPAFSEKRYSRRHGRATD